jgi:hypothetical protein
MRSRIYTYFTCFYMNISCQSASLTVTSNISADIISRNRNNQLEGRKVLCGDTTKNNTYEYSVRPSMLIARTHSILDLARLPSSRFSVHEC